MDMKLKRTFAGILTAIMLLSSVNVGAFATTSGTADSVSGIITSPVPEKVAAEPSAPQTGSSTPAAETETSKTPDSTEQSETPAQGGTTAPETEPTAIPETAASPEPTAMPEPSESPKPEETNTYAQGETVNYAVYMQSAKNADAFAPLFPITIGLYGANPEQGAIVRLKDMQITFDQLVCNDGVYSGAFVFDLAGLPKCASLSVKADCCASGELKYAYDETYGTELARTGGFIFGSAAENGMPMVIIMDDAESPADPAAAYMTYNYNVDLSLSIDGIAVNPKLGFTVVSDPNEAALSVTGPTGSAGNGYTVSFGSGTGADKHNITLPFTLAAANGKSISGAVTVNISTGSYTVALASPDGAYSLSPASADGSAEAGETVYVIKPDTAFSANTLSALDLAVHWRDNNNSRGKRPDSNAVTLQIQKLTGDKWEDVSGTVTWDTANSDCWHAKISDLPAYDDAGNPAVYRVKEMTPDSYAVSSGEDYVEFVNDKAEITNRLLTDVTVYKLWNDGALGGAHPDPVDCLKSLIFYADGQPIKYDPDNKIYDYEIDTTGDIWILRFKNLIAYDDNNLAIEYYIVENFGDDLINFPQTKGKTGKYVQSMMNTGNYAGMTNGAYDGGYLISTLTDTVNFAATKKWVDAGLDKNNRPEVSFSILAYIKESDTELRSATPSPVAGVETPSIKGADRLEDEYTLKIDNLPKYDSEGYEYVYFLEEEMTGDTAGLYASSAVNNETIDTLKGLITNGSIVTNSAAEQYIPSITKVWNAKSVLSLGGISATFQFQQSMDKETWTNVGDEFTIDGFSREVYAITRSLDESYPGTDDDGNTIYYRFVETGMTVGEIEAERKGENFVVEYDGNQYIFNAEQTVIDPTKTAMGTVTNRLDNKTAFKIQKTWGNVEAGDELYITVQLYRDGEPYPLTEENITDGAGNKIDGAEIVDGGMVKFSYEAADGTTERFLSNLPLYDDEGRRYTYTAFEREHTGDYSQGETEYGKADYEIDGFTRKINYVGFTNTKTDEGDGVVLHFEIMKRWNDDSDLPARAPVTVGIYYNDPTDTEKHEQVQTAVLSDDNCWTADVHIKADPDKASERNNLKNYSVIEISSEDGWTLPMDAAYITTGNTSDTPAALSVNGKTYAFKVVTAKHDEGQYSNTVITNTRVGAVNLGLTKTWNMGTESSEAVFRLVRYDAVGNQTPIANAASTAGGTAVTTDENGEFRLTPSDFDGLSSVTVNFELPKYDENGVLLSYGIEEIALVLDGIEEKFDDNKITLDEMKFVLSSSLVKYDVSKDETKDPDRMSVAIENRLGGSGTLIVNKVWHDSGSGSRPDITLKLYRRLKDRQSNSELLSTHYKWDTWINDYFWQCAFTGKTFDRYNDEGFEYEYYVIEEIVTQNSGYSSTYNNTTDNQPQKTGDTAKDVYPYFGNAQSAIAAFVPQNKDEAKPGTVINTRKATRSYSGEKTWKDLPDGYDRTQLPEIVIMLFCRSDGEERVYDQAHAAKDVSGVEVAPVSLSDGGTLFSWKNLPEYDAYGALLYYYAAEVESASGEGLYNEITELPAYDIKYIEGTNGITNQYTGGGALSITVKKHWDWSQMVTGTEYPEATFTLFRSYDGGENWEEIDTVTLEGGTVPEDKQKDVTATFPSENGPVLSIYAPNNEKYIYKVEETAINGYKTEYTSDPEGKVAIDENNEGSVAITNTYLYETDTLEFTKIWNDQNNLFNTRPETGDMSFELWYSFENEDKKVEDAAYTCEPDGANWKITFTINGKFIMNDTDGTPYKYYVKENYEGDKAEHYALIYGTNECAPGASALINPLKTVTISVNKIWRDKNGAEFTAQELRDLKRLGKLPDSVTFGVEYITGEKYSAFTGSDGNQITQTWSIDELIKAVEDNSYLKFTQVLPKYDESDAEYKYRAVEITGETQTAKYKSTVGETAVNGSSFVTDIVNTFDGVKQKLHVYKLWHDKNNTDGVRPDSIAVTVTEYVGETAANSTDMTLLPEATDDFNFWYAYITVLVDNTDISYSVTEAVPTGYEEVFNKTGYPLGIALDGTKDGISDISEIIPANGQTAVAVPAAGDYSFTLMNEHTPYTINAAGEKTWSGDDNWQKTTRPATVKLQLMQSADGNNWTEVGDPVEVSSDVNWKHEWVNLPVNKEKTKASDSVVTYSYKVAESETAADKQYSTEDSKSKKAITATNQTHKVSNTLKTVSLNVEKKWQGGEPDVLNNTTVKVQLQRLVDAEKDIWENVKDDSGKEFFLELSKASNWKGTFADFPKCDDEGSDYTYRALELTEKDWFEEGEPSASGANYTLNNKILHYLTIDNITDNPVTHETNVGGFVNVAGEPKQLDISGPIKNGLSASWANDQYWQHTGSISVEYLEFDTEEWKTITCAADNIAPLLERFPDAKIAIAGSGDTLEYTLTLNSSADTMPYKAVIKVGFRPTLAVENTTLNDKNGAVAIQKADRSYDGRYPALTVKGYADSGYAVDFRHLQIGNPKEVSSWWQLNIGAKDIKTDTYGARFTVYVTAKLAGKTEAVPISGTVSFDKRDAYGNPTEVTITLDSLPIPLDIGIPFTKSVAPIRPRTADDSELTLLTAMCSLSLIGCGAVTFALCRGKKKRRGERG